MKLRIAIFTSIGIIVFGLVYTMVFNFSVDPGFIYIKNIDVSDSKITLKGHILGSAEQFKGYKIKHSGNVLYITIKGSLVTSSPSKGDIDISVANTYGEIEKIYLRGGKKSGNILIWPKS